MDTSLITIAYTSYLEDEIIKVFLRSVKQKCSPHLREIIVVYNSAESFEHIEQDGRITIKHIGITYTPHGSVHKGLVNLPPVAFHQGLKHASCPYIILSDADVVIYKHKFDDFYRRLYEQLDLNIVGCSHYNIKRQAYQTFPTHINLLMHQSKMPDEEFSKKCKIRPLLAKDLNPNDDYKVVEGDRYLLGGAMPGRYKEFPKPTGLFDGCCNLYLWDKDNGSRALTFIAKNSEKFSAYQTARFHTNFDSDLTLPSEKFLAHWARSRRKAKNPKLSDGNDVYRESTHVEAANVIAAEMSKELKSLLL